MHHTNAISVAMSVVLKTPTVLAVTVKMIPPKCHHTFVTDRHTKRRVPLPLPLPLLLPHLRLIARRSDVIAKLTDTATFLHSLTLALKIRNVAVHGTLLATANTRDLATWNYRQDAFMTRIAKEVLMLLQLLLPPLLLLPSAVLSMLSPMVRLIPTCVVSIGIIALVILVA
jgi:hypothetical protein